MENIVLLKDMLGTLKKCDFKDAVIPMGKDVNGNYVYENFLKMNHILIAGSTGSGKSVFLNNVIVSLTKQLNSSKLDLILIDPKTIEFSQYSEKKYAYYDVEANEVNHLFEDLIKEMERRYGLFVDCEIKNIEEYNSLDENKNNQLKHIVVLIDELVDIGMNCEEACKNLIRLVQKSRASGINFVVATQCIHLISENRETIKDVINNFPTHIAFRLCDNKDSKLIIDTNEAVNLKPMGEGIVVLPNKKYQVQTPYVSYKEELELVRENDCELLDYLTKYISKEDKNETINDAMAKITVLNMTNENFDKKLSKYIHLQEYFEKVDLFSCDEKKILDTDFLCLVYNEESDLTKDKIKNIIDNAKEINLFCVSIKNKQVDEIADICNEISSLLCEPGIINIEPEDMKGKDIVDAFIVRKREGIDFKKDYIETFENKVSKIKNLGQIVISITGGYDTGLEEIYEYVEAMGKVIPKDINLIFGTSMSKENNGICKIAIFFQSGDNISHIENIEGKLKLAHEKFIEENKNIKTIEDEVHSSEFYKTQIDAFCDFEEISISTLQRFLRLGFSKAAKIIDDWTDKGYLEKNEHKWKVVNRQAIYESLYEIFKEKL